MRTGLGYKASPLYPLVCRPRFDLTLIVGWLIIAMNLAAIALAVVA